MPALRWNANIVWNWVLYAEYSLCKTPTSSISLSRFTTKQKSFLVFANTIKAGYWCTHSDSLAEVLWVIRVFKRICADEHHIECYSTRPNISNLIFHMWCFKVSVAMLRTSKQWTNTTDITFPSYSFLERTSGAIYAGVPTVDFGWECSTEDWKWKGPQRKVVV